MLTDDEHDHEEDEEEEELLQLRPPHHHHHHHHHPHPKNNNGNRYNGNAADAVNYYTHRHLNHDMLTTDAPYNINVINHKQLAGAAIMSCPQSMFNRIANPTSAALYCTMPSSASTPATHNNDDDDDHYDYGNGNGSYGDDNDTSNHWMLHSSMVSYSNSMDGVGDADKPAGGCLAGSTGRGSSLSSGSEDPEDLHHHGRVPMNIISCVPPPAMNISSSSGTLAARGGGGGGVANYNRNNNNHSNSNGGCVGAAGADVNAAAGGGGGAAAAATLRYIKYTAEQVQALEVVYQRCPKPSSAARQQLIRDNPLLHHIHPQQIKVWFQNRRCREKQRRETTRLQSVNGKLIAMNKLLMEENESLQKQVSHLMCEKEYLLQRLHHLVPSPNLLLNTNIGHTSNANNVDHDVMNNTDNHKYPNNVETDHNIPNIANYNLSPCNG